MYKDKTCKYCHEVFTPTYANQRVHAKCRRSWRRKTGRIYQREWQRRYRKELKRDWEDCLNNETQGATETFK